MASDQFGEGTYGSGTYGDISVTDSLNLHVKPGSKTASVLTLEWTAQTGVYGYRLLKNGNPISYSWDGTKTTWRVSYVAGDKFTVVPVAAKPSAAVQV